MKEDKESNFLKKMGDKRTVIINIYRTVTFKGELTNLNKQHPKDKIQHYGWICLCWSKPSFDFLEQNKRS